MIAVVEEHLEAIRALCREYGVARLEIFGSAVIDSFNASCSDIDFLVESPPDYDFGRWLGRVQNLELALGNLLGRTVELVTTSARRDPWFWREADKTRQVVYDASQVAAAAWRHHECQCEGGVDDRGMHTWS